MFNQNKIWHKPLLIFLSLLMVTQTVGLILFLPKSAQAQAIVSDPVAVTQRSRIEAIRQLQRQGDKAEEKIQDIIFKTFVLSAAVSLKNVAIFWAKKMGERTTKWILTGKWGQEPMIETKTIDYLIEQMGEYTVGQTLDLLRVANPWSDYIDICEPSLNFKLQFNITIGGYETFEGRKAECRFSKVQANWDNFVEDLQSKSKSIYKNLKGEGRNTYLSLALLDIFAEGFHPSQGEVGQWITASNFAMEFQNKIFYKEIVKRQEEPESKSLSNITDQYKVTPSKVTEKMIEEEVPKKVTYNPKDELEMAGDIVTTIPQQMVLAFLSSFISQQFLTAFYDKLRGWINPVSSIDKKEKFYNYYKEAERHISKIQKIKFNINSQEIDLLSEFSVCNDNNRFINNCVMSSQFADIVRQGNYGKPLTVREFVEKYKELGDLPFINDNRVKDSFCFEKGWCYPNLMKMRKARIIPIGWELAALQAKSGETLAMAVDGFSDCPDATGKCPSNSKYGCRFCHLVDPNWVIKIPKIMCKMKVPGPFLVTAGVEERADYCADEVSCIKTNDDGSCAAFGYCAAEKNIWRFGGTECPGQFDSCTVLEDSQGNEVAYLLNTVDSSGCNADNVGCKWYSTSLSYNVGVNSVWSKNDKAYFNKNLLEYECSPEDEGCTRLIDTSVFGVNLLPNGNFEYINSNKTPEGFTGKVDDIEGEGNKSLILQTVDLTEVKITPKNFERYFSVSAKVNLTSSQFNLGVISSTASSVVKDTQCYFEQNFGTYTCKKSLYSQHDNLTELSLDSWQDIRMIVNVPANTLSLKLVFGGSGFIDDLSLSEIQNPNAPKVSTYYVPYADIIGQLFVKKAPDYLGCYNDDKGKLNYTPEKVSEIDEVVRPARCSEFAEICAAEEVGCQKYTPIDGGNSITGVASFNDTCPAACVGYDTYSQMATAFAPKKFPIYMIPSTAKTCSATEVGCEEFTNLDTLKAGGEGREYYTYLRQCVKANEPTCANFYTWTGSDVSGYQLQVHRLKASNNGEPAITNPAADALCDEALYNSGTHPSCRQFYNDQGQVSYHFSEYTISCSDDCHPYRRTNKYTNPADCTNHGGILNNENECIFMAIPSQGKKCSAANVNCAEFRGNNAAKSVELLNENFEGLVSGWTGGKISSVSMDNNGKSYLGNVSAGQNITIKKDVYGVGDQSYLLTFWAKPETAWQTINIYLKDASDNVVAQEVNFALDLLPPENITNGFRMYSVQLNPSASFVSLNFEVTSSTVWFDNIKLKSVNDTKYLIANSWTTNPICDRTLMNQETIVPQAQLGCRAYKDSTGAEVYLKSLSSICRPEAVGCQAFIDTKNTASPFAKDDYGNGFKTQADSLIYLINDPDKYCTANGQGCTQVGLPEIDEAASSNYDAVMKNKEGVEIWNNQFYKLLPDQFEMQNIMCDKTVVGCEEYVDKNGAKKYFRDPGNRICVWKSVEIGGNKENLWMKKDGTGQCPGANNSRYQDGVKNMASPGESGYLQWVGECAKIYNGCTAFLDPLNVSGNKLAKQAYYNIKDSLDYSSCDGKVSLGAGCLLFNDTSERDDQNRPKLLFSAKKTYDKSEKLDDVVAPLAGITFVDSAKFINFLLQKNVNCNDFKDNDYCQFIKDCTAGEENDFECIKFVDNDKNIVADDTETDASGKLYNGGNLVGCDMNDEKAPEKLACYIFTKTDTYNDSNKIIKVERDRECAQWYDCISGYYIWDDFLQKYIYRCSQLSLCDSYDFNSNKCNHYVSNNDYSTEFLLTKNEILNEDNYKNRPISWSSLEYSGYSLVGKYPLQFYNVFDFNKNNNSLLSDFRLARFVDNKKCEQDPECAVKEGYKNVCYEGKCVYFDIESQSGFKSVRAYAKNDAPFPRSAKQKLENFFSNVNECEIERDVEGNEIPQKDRKLSDDYDCGANYILKTYGNKALKKYFPTLIANKMEISKYDGYCQNDENRMCTCNDPSSNDSICKSDDCDSDNFSMCLKKDAEETHYQGMEGYCMEYDMSISKDGNDQKHPCYTWYPLEQMKGLQDRYYQYEEAGYCPECYTGDLDVGNLFCLRAAGLRDKNRCYSRERKDVLEKDYMSLINTVDFGDDPLSFIVKEVQKLTEEYDDGFCDFSQREKNLINVKTAWLSGGEDGIYLEVYRKPWWVDEMPIYEDQLAAIAIKCSDVPIDSGFCGDKEKGSKSTDWYNYQKNKILEYLKLKDFENYPKIKKLFEEGFFVIPRGYHEEDRLGNLVTSKGSLANMTFYTDKGEPYKKYEKNKWKYWQVVWSGYEANSYGGNIINDYILETPLPKNNIKPKKFKTPLFVGTGQAMNYSDAFNKEIKKKELPYNCANILTKQVWDDYENSPCYFSEVQEKFPYYYKKGYLPKILSVLDENKDFANTYDIAIYIYDDEKELILNEKWKKNKESLYKSKLKESLNPSTYQNNKNNKYVWQVWKTFGVLGGSGTKELISIRRMDGENNIIVEAPDKNQYISNVNCCINGNEGEKFEEVCNEGWVCGKSCFCELPKLVVTQKVKDDDLIIVSNCDTYIDGVDTGEKNGIPGGHSNYFGLRVMFDEKGKYQGLWYSMCNDGDGNGGQQLEVYFLFNEQCSEVAEFNNRDNINFSNENKMFTNKIYMSKINNWSFDNDLLNKSPNVGFYSSLLPLGSAFGRDATALKNSAPLIIHGQGSPDEYDKKEDEEDDDENNNKKETESIKDPGGSPFVVFMNKKYVFGGKPYDCVSGSTLHCDYENNYNKAFKSDVDIFRGAYFANLYDYYKLDDTTRSYINNKNFIKDKDVSFRFVKHPPVVAAVKKNNVGRLIAVPNNITINDNINGDVLVNSGQTVRVTFYAWADDDQMPLRKILFDWNDGLDPIIIEGKFRNYKPRCQREKDEVLGHCRSITPTPAVINGYSCYDDFDCESNACNKENFPYFGDTDEACDERYYIFEKVYNCSKEKIQNAVFYIDDDGQSASLSESWSFYNCPDPDGCVLPNYKWPDGTKGACVFVPRVQVLDNWGWCNAEKDSQCHYPDYAGNIIADSAGTRTFPSGLDGCYNDFDDDNNNEIEEQCNISSQQVENYKPWTVFKGRVIVKPE